MAIPKEMHDVLRSRQERVPEDDHPVEAVALQDSLGEIDADLERRQQCVDLFLENARDLGLLRTVADAERILPTEQVLEEFPSADVSA